MAGDEVALGGDIGRRGVGARLDRLHERRRSEHLEAHRVGEVARDVFGKGDGRARVLRLDRRDLVVQRLQRVQVLRLLSGEVRRVLRVERGERGRGRIGDLRHRRRVVPDVDVDVVLCAEELLHVDDDAVGFRRCAQQLLHEVVVTDPVHDDELRVGDELRGRRAGLVFVGVGARIAQDARRGHARPADLSEEVGVEVFRAEHRYGRAGRGGGGGDRWTARAQGNDGDGDQDPSH